MPEETKKKKTPGEEYVDALAQAGTVQQTASEQAAAELAQAQERQAAEIARNQQANQQAFAQVAQNVYNDQRKAEEEDLAKRQMEDKRTAFTGITELASSLANLVGVGSFNSANQTYNSYSKSWMEKADQERKLRQGRIDNLKERKRQLDQQLATLRSGDANTLANLRGQHAQAQAQMAMNAANAKYQNDANIAKAKYTADVTDQQRADKMATDAQNRKDKNNIDLLNAVVNAAYKGVEIPGINIKKVADNAKVNEVEDFLKGLGVTL